VFTKPLGPIFLGVLMTASAFPQDTPTPDSRTARESVAGGAQAASSGPNPTSGSNTSAKAATTLLIGEQNVEGQVDYDFVGQAEAFQATAINSGTVGSLSIYLDASSASTRLFLGIYTGSGTGHPAELLGQGSSIQLQAGAWNTIQVPPISVTKGDTYWIALLGVHGGRPTFRDRHNANCIAETSSQTALTSLPATWTTGKDWLTSCPLSAYGLSSGTAGVLTARPSSVNFEDVIVGDNSALPVMLTNTGTASLTISAATATGAAFGISGLSLPLTLNPGNKKSFSADFAPTVTGAATGHISLTSNASEPSLVVPLAGTGVKAHSVTLSWTASTSKGVIGYDVYRGGKSGGPYILLNPALVPGTSYTDSAVQAGGTYYYVTATVNSKHVESSYSNQVKAVVPSP
jgi:Abnormal spindle-like microcephaly-assoc'd, ASPM-SPD-2-Hydin